MPKKIFRICLSASIGDRMRKAAASGLAFRLPDRLLRVRMEQSRPGIWRPGEPVLRSIFTVTELSLFSVKMGFGKR